MLWTSNCHALFCWMVGLAFCIVQPALALEDYRYCGSKGVWLQILGSGALEFDNKRIGPSYVVWHDDKAVALIDAGVGTTYGFGEAGANFEDLEVIVITRGTIDRISELPALFAASMNAGRERLLTVLGPSGYEEHIGIVERMNRLMGPSGAWPELAGILTLKSPAGYRLRVREVRAFGNRSWSEFMNPVVDVSAIPVYHGGIPSLAWKVKVAGKTVVFAGSSNNQKDTLTQFAKGADALVVSHQIRDSDRGTRTAKYMSPTKIGQIAQRIGVRFVVLGDRGGPALGMELINMDKVEKEFEGTVIFADDLECWGL